MNISYIKLINIHFCFLNKRIYMSYCNFKIKFRFKNQIYILKLSIFLVAFLTRSMLFYLLKISKFCI
jgi:hypothetical protein